MATSLRECYELLGLPTNATEEDVRKAYKQKARECHPDKNPGDPQATEKFQALRQGYERIVSASSEEPDDVRHFGGFDSFFHFVMFREMMRQRMREEMMARMFGGVFDDDSDLDEDDFPFGAFGMPFFYRPWHHESSARSHNQRYSRHGTSSHERGSSAKAPKKQKGRKKDPRKESYPDRGASSEAPWPKQAQSQGNDSTKQDYETTKGNYGQGDCETEKENWEESQKSAIFTKSKQKKNRSQMTASEWQKGRKTKKNHKRKQTAKCSSSSQFKSKTREQNSGREKESETSTEKGQQLPQQATGNRKEREEHMCSPSPSNEEWTLEDKTKQEKTRLSSDQSSHFEAFSFVEDEKNSNNGSETDDKHDDCCDEEDRLRNNPNTGKNVKFPQEDHKIMFDSGEEFMATQPNNLTKEIPKNDDKANISLEDCKMDLNIKSGKNERESYECHQCDVDKEPLQTPPFEEMKQACEGTTEETPSGRENNQYSTASTATTNNKASVSASEVNRVQKGEKENVTPAHFDKTTNPCGIESKGKKKESVETNKKDCERKKDCSDDNINAGITQTVNAEDHVNKLEQRIPQKKVRQGGANSFKLKEKAGYFSIWNKTDKNKYAAKAKSQFDGHLKSKSSLHELQSDSKESQKLTGNTLNRGNGTAKMQGATESLSKEDSDNSSMTSCNTTANENMTSASSSSEAANQDILSEQAEPIAYRKAPLDDELKLRRPSKHKKRQERRQRRFNELLSGNTLNTNLLSNEERSSSGV